MENILSDVVKEIAQGKSVISQRLHGGISNTIVAGITAANFCPKDNVVYLCPIPWHARILDISIILDKKIKFTTGPIGYLSVRRIPSVPPVTADEIASVDYEALKNTVIDNLETFAGVGQIAKGAEVPIMSGLLTWDNDGEPEAGEEHKVLLPLGTRTHTLAECYAVASTSKLLDSAKDAATKDHYGMLTFVNTTAGAIESGSANAAISITYIDPAPSGITIGKITRNGK